VALLLLLPLLQLVLLECANIALNLLAQQRKRLAQERTAQSLKGNTALDDTAAAGTTGVAAAAAATTMAVADAKAAPAAAESKAAGVGGSAASKSTVQPDVASTAKQIQQPQAADGGG
jgi:hypothetical protein